MSFGALGLGAKLETCNMKDVFQLGQKVNTAEAEDAYNIPSLDSPHSHRSELASDTHTGDSESNLQHSSGHKSDSRKSHTGDIPSSSMGGLSSSLGMFAPEPQTPSPKRKPRPKRPTPPPTYSAFSSTPSKSTCCKWFSDLGMPKSSRSLLEELSCSNKSIAKRWRQHVRNFLPRIPRTLGQHNAAAYSRRLVFPARWSVPFRVDVVELKRPRGECPLLDDWDITIPPTNQFDCTGRGRERDGVNKEMYEFHGNTGKKGAKGEPLRARLQDWLKAGGATMSSGRHLIQDIRLEEVREGVARGPRYARMVLEVEPFFHRDFADVPRQVYRWLETLGYVDGKGEVASGLPLEIEVLDGKQEAQPVLSESEISKEAADLWACIRQQCPNLQTPSDLLPAEVSSTARLFSWNRLGEGPKVNKHVVVVSVRMKKEIKVRWDLAHKEMCEELEDAAGSDTFDIIFQPVF